MEDPKYKTEIDKFFEDTLRDSYVSDNDWKEFYEQFKKEKLFDYNSLAEQIDVGIANGYSLESQFQLLNNLLKHSL